jgi:hypothetical protein
MSTLVLHLLLIKNINKENGFQCVVLGHTVRVKVWMYYFIGDTKGNNGWVNILGIERV